MAQTEYRAELKNLRKLLTEARHDVASAQDRVNNLAQAILHLERGIEAKPDNHLRAGLGIVEGAEQVFAANGDAPMSVRDLSNALLRIGVESKSKRFPATVYATVWGSAKFTRLASGAWCRTVAAPKDEAAAWGKQREVFLATKAQGKGKQARRRKRR